ncbi:MAG: NAD(P)H-quinone oxidoreductase subunit F [Scytolyngbya sp. HA4215-MV1]|nr:NAD(P)H-quinone oxidoreductase subunit F [Scytolyngbya sp. HA4215-MV1]
MHEFLIQTSWWIPTYGLIGAVLTLPWSMGIIRRTGPRPAAYFNLLMTLLSLAHSVWVWQMTLGQPHQLLEFQWFRAVDLDLSFSLEISPVSVGAAVLITGLSLLAQLYALGYMEIDWGLARFFGLMGFFEGAMTGIVLSDSLFLSYALLEMLTLSTYLLVGFWYVQPLVVTAARDAFLTKRVGDLILLMGVVAVSTFTGSLNFSDLTQWAWAETTVLDPNVATLLGLALIAGPVGKCAQFPLHLWLDEAMEGPNPASILRNSVVVACGAYVLIKLQPVLSLSPVVLNVLLILGTMTAIGAALVAIAQIDIKRALSHSTNSYLGLVFIAVGMGQTELALILLFTHAITKALIFLSVGGVMNVTYTQDLTEMGGLASRMPFTTGAYIIGAMGVLAMPPLGGFWAMLQWIDGLWVVPLWLDIVVLLFNGLTAFSLMRVFGLVFMGEVKPKTRRAPEVGWAQAVPMVALVILTLLMPLMLYRWGLLPGWSAVNWRVAISLMLSTLVGAGLGAWIYANSGWEKPIRFPWKPVQVLLAEDFGILRIYQLSVVLVVSLLSKLAAWIDRYIVDGMVNLVGLFTLVSGEGLKYSGFGKSQLYVMTILLAMALIGVVLSFPFLSHLMSIAS